MQLTERFQNAAVMGALGCHSHQQTQPLVLQLQENIKHTSLQLMKQHSGQILRPTAGMMGIRTKRTVGMTKTVNRATNKAKLF